MFNKIKFAVPENIHTHPRKINGNFKGKGGGGRKERGWGVQTEKPSMGGGEGM